LQIKSLGHPKPTSPCRRLGNALGNESALSKFKRDGDFVVVAFGLTCRAMRRNQIGLCPRQLAEMRNSGVRGSLSKVIDSLAAGYPFSIVSLLEFEDRCRIPLQ
jgi:hypothetical protein